MDYEAYSKISRSGYISFKSALANSEMEE